MSDRPISTRQLAYLRPWLEDVSQARMESLGVTGGFSGAVIWHVTVSGVVEGHNAAEKNLCLRRWPQVHPSLTGLLAIHGLQQHVSAAGYGLVPVPLATHQGETYFVHEDHLWELTTWLPGEASFASSPSAAKLDAAVITLAQFHQAAQNYSYQSESARLAPSPGLQQRLTMIRTLQQGELQQLWRETRSAEASDLRELAFELLEGIGQSLDAVGRYLEQIVEVPLPLQWCLRDVRHDHILFTDDEIEGERVSGLIDFGAVAVESVAGDLARLLGSIVLDHDDTWRAGIEAYGQQCPLSTAERRAIVGFDHGGLLGSAANWVRWLFVEGRSFPQIHALHAQLLWLRDRLQTLASHSNASVTGQLSGPTWLEHSASSSASSPASGSPHRSNVSPWTHT